MQPPTCGHLPVHRVVNGAQVTQGKLGEPRSVRFTRQLVRADEHGYVDVQHGLVVDGFELRRSRGQELGNTGDGSYPLLDVGDITSALGDGELTGTAHSPVVDNVTEDIDRRRQDVRAQCDRTVLIEGAWEFQRVRIPEGAPEYFVPRCPVAQQDRAAGDVGPLDRLFERLVMQPGRLEACGLKPTDSTAGNVRACAFKRGDQQLVCVRVHQVIAVGEGEIRRGCLTHPCIASWAKTAVGLLNKPEPRIASGKRLGDERAAVGGPVVHHDHLDVLQRLPSDRLESLSEVCLNVEKRHYDTEPRPVYTLLRP